MAAPRITTVTRLPRAEKTWANSAAMNPPPTITRCSGNSAIRMIVSLVWNSTPESAITSGTTARDPAAMTTRSAVNSSSASVRSRKPSAVRPANRVWLAYTVTFGKERR